MTQLKSQETRGTTDGNLGRERQSRLSGLVDFCHCGRRGARDRAYSTISPSSDTQTTGASTDKISHPTSMRSPKTFPSPSWSIDRKRSGRDKYDCNRYSVPYQKIYHRFLPIHQPKRYLSEWGESCDWSHRNARSRAPGDDLAQLGYEVPVGPVALERFANKTNKVGRMRVLRSDAPYQLRF